VKEHFIVELLGKSHVGESVLALGWVAAKRKFKDLVFLDLADSTGRIQVVADNRHNSEAFSTCQTILPESSVMVTGRLQSGQSGQLELLADEVQLIGGVAEPVSPSPRSAFDVFDDAFVDQVLRYRHLFLRNERLMAALRFRHLLTGILHDWFREQGFVQVDAPVLTQLPLYDDDSAISLEFFSRKVFLTQCVAFYLESAVCAFEKVYNLGPSFRAEKSKSRRHLAEYWHVKAEIAFADLEDIMSFTERMISYIVLRASQECNAELEAFGRALAIEQIIRAPYPRLTYSEAWGRLRAGGLDPEWGRSFGGVPIKRW
jgi:asparaginyl-tRNA synthetase